MPGSYNFSGIKNPAVDALINHIIAARDFSELKTACRALDRVLLWNYYAIPEWHLNYHRIAYRNTLRAPDIDVPMLVPSYTEVAALTWWMNPAAVK